MPVPRSRWRAYFGQTRSALASAAPSEASSMKTRMRALGDLVKETVGERVRRLRRDRGMSQRALSDPGISYAYVSRIEAGQRNPSLKAIRLLARKLGVTPEYLETGARIPLAKEQELRIADAELELRLGRDTGRAEATLTP